MKILKWVIGIVLLLVALFFLVIRPYAIKQTKKHSPEATNVYNNNGYDLSVHYSSPFKKGRDIFGALVPYGVTWRTGANEPTTFTTKTDIKIADKTIPVGTYSLWTIPNQNEWEIIFNSDIPSWGVSSSGASHDPKYDVVRFKVPVEILTTTIESFTIDFEDNIDLNLILSWDDTKISVPLTK